MKATRSKSHTASVRKDLYTQVTAHVIADLEKGVRPWSKPWSSGNAAGRITIPLRHNGVPYRGINILLLWGAALESGFTRNTWMTYRQAVELGAHVRKGEHGSMVVYADRFTRTHVNEAGEETEMAIPFLKTYTVFNVEQIEGLPAPYQIPPAVPKDAFPRIEAAETFFTATGADIRHGRNSAYYAPGPDRIQLPPPEAFVDAESYTATKAHELIHWTRHETRLDRDLGRKRWGDAGYAREELVAEIGAAFICAALEITLEPREDHAAYIASWLEVLKKDNRAIFSAAAHAQKAVDYLHGFQGGEVQAA